MCSTPLGITARGTISTTTAGGLDSSCAQRLSASRQEGRTHLPTQGNHQVVLNASRHHGKGDPVADAFEIISWRCSTPLGITARGTGKPRAFDQPRGVLNASRHHGKGDWRSGRTISTARGSAQRLSASRQGGHPYLLGQASADMCSTPLGITARGTQVLLNLAKADALCSTPLGITARGTPRPRRRRPSPLGAQRLSASRQGGPRLSGARMLRNGCAQRLSASRQGRPEPAWVSFSHASPCSTPLGITARGTAHEPKWDTINFVECSTPLGITARGTREGADERARARSVLNASRHHGKGDEAFT